jgi:hypothetical protein
MSDQTNRSVGRCPFAASRRRCSFWRGSALGPHSERRLLGALDPDRGRHAFRGPRDARCRRRRPRRRDPVRGASSSLVGKSRVPFPVPSFAGLPRLPPDRARPPLSPTRSGAAARTANSALTPPPSPPASARSTGLSPPPPPSPSPTATASPIATPPSPPSRSSPAAATPPSSRGAARFTPGAGIRTTPSASTPRRSG